MATRYASSSSMVIVMEIFVLTLVLQLSAVASGDDETTLDEETPQKDDRHGSSYTNGVSYLEYIRQHNEPPPPPSDQCQILNQIQASMLQMMNSHTEYGKGIHSLHNVADSLETDVTVLKSRLFALEELAAQFHGVDLRDDLEGLYKEQTSSRVTFLRRRHNHRDKTISAGEQPRDVRIRGSSSTGTSSINRSVTHLNRAVHNLTMYISAQQEKFLSLEKKYKKLRRKLKSAENEMDRHASGFASKTTQDRDEALSVKHFMERQKDINSAVQQQFQQMEEAWKRLMLQQDSPGPGGNNGRYDMTMSQIGNIADTFRMHA